MKRAQATFATDQRGVAAVEAALIGALLVGALLNVAEVSRYAYLAMEVNAASQAGAQAALVTCKTTETPITTKCPAAAQAIATAVKGTSLGDEVTLDGNVTEGWYCVTTDSELRLMGDASSKPNDCSGGQLSGASPALYIQVQTTYTYQAMFPGLTLVRAFPEKIVRSSWMRVL